MIKLTLEKNSKIKEKTPTIYLYDNKCCFTTCGGSRLVHRYIKEPKETTPVNITGIKYYTFGFDIFSIH